MRTMLFRKEKATFNDIWHVLGLRGTGSNAYEVNDLFVPEAYTTWRDLPCRPARRRTARATFRC